MGSRSIISIVLWLLRNILAHADILLYQLFLLTPLASRLPDASVTALTHLLTSASNDSGYTIIKVQESRSVSRAHPLEDSNSRGASGHSTASSLQAWDRR
ncbi:hypothetical protein EDB19DRAFT_1655165 [Suillus lakei]|nr:hypothetical protein EDB19DRAFT_1655165 [Suillus lakei]